METDNVLGEFLKARRGQVPPSRDVPASGRRRVAGLRREEPARLAGISEPYLTRLEQGVDRHPSPQVLRALARALELDVDTSAHMFVLAASHPVQHAETEVTEDVHQLLDTWVGSPAYVRNRRFDVLAANKQARAPAPMYEPGHNLARDMFLDPDIRGRPRPAPVTNVRHGRRRRRTASCTPARLGVQRGARKNSVGSRAGSADDDRELPR